MLTDTQLEELSRKMDFPLVGVFFKDELPRKIEYNKGYMINLDDSIDENGDENEGTHWTCLQVNQYSSGQIEPIFFDPYGAPPSESIKQFVLENTGKKLPYTEKDVQSLMNNACGYFCAAFLHYINTWELRTKDLYTDVGMFLNYFDDLNKSIDWKKNEYILKLFFQSSDPTLRKEIDVISHPEHITQADTGKGIDILKIPVSTKLMG
jgi:hypothetical protein